MIFLAVAGAGWSHRNKGKEAKRGCDWFEPPGVRLHWTRTSARFDFDCLTLLFVTCSFIFFFFLSTTKMFLIYFQWFCETRRITPWEPSCVLISQLNLGPRPSFISALKSAALTLLLGNRGGSSNQISPSAEEGGSRAVIDPFNWCGFNYDNRLPELLLFCFP